jgi:hypothetical protein
LKQSTSKQIPGNISTLGQEKEKSFYDITLPLAIVNYPGASKTMNFLSSCLWFYGNTGSENTRIFSYDALNSFVFGINSGTSLTSRIIGFSSISESRHLEIILGDICIGYFEATRGYVIYSPRRAAPR